MSGVRSCDGHPQPWLNIDRGSSHHAPEDCKSPISWPLPMPSSLTAPLSDSEVPWDGVAAHSSL